MTYGKPSFISFTGAVSAEKNNNLHFALNQVPIIQVVTKSLLAVTATVFIVKTAKEKQALTVPNETLLELVNDFYKIHFFELPDTYDVKKQVVLKNNNTVATVVTKQVNVSSKKLCIQLRTYKKCVTIVDNQPVEAAELVKKIEGLFLSKR